MVVQERAKDVDKTKVAALVEIDILQVVEACWEDEATLAFNQEADVFGFVILTVDLCLFEDEHGSQLGANPSKKLIWLIFEN